MGVDGLCKADIFDEYFEDEEQEQFSSDGMVCPYCGYIHDFWDFEDPSYYENGTFNCVECGREFSSVCDTVHMWTTNKLGD